MWLSEDGGATFNYCASDFGKTPIFDLMQNWRTWDEGCYKPGQVYIGTHGRGIWTTDAYLSVSEPIDNTALTAAITDLLIYPNPVKTFTMLTFNAEESGAGMINVYNLAGQLMKTIEGVEVLKGNNEIALSVDELPKGTYIVNVSTQKESKTTKLIKQ